MSLIINTFHYTFKHLYKYLYIKLHIIKLFNIYHKKLLVFVVYFVAIDNQFIINKLSYCDKLENDIKY